MHSISTVASRGLAVFLTLTTAQVSFPATFWSDSGASESSAAVEVLVQSLEASQSLYRNLDVTWEENYEWVAVHTPVDTVIREKSRGRSVRQEGMLYLNYEGRKSVAGDQADRTATVHHHVGYDGETTRLLEHRGSYIGNERNDVVYNWRMFDPHAFPLRHAMKKVPLSVWLRGKQACVEHPFGNASDFENGRELRAVYEGEETVAGLPCARVTLLSLRSRTDGTMRVSGRRVFWLARERNFLPIQTHSFNHYYSKDLPVEKSVLSDLRELEPGVWFPFRGRITVFDELALRDSHRVAVSSIRELSVRRASLKPRHQNAFFQNVTFPDGTAVYRVVDGHIVESRIQGRASGSRHAPAKVPGTRWIPIVVANALAVVCLVAVILHRRKLKSECAIRTR